jgi:hypothetical protein
MTRKSGQQQKRGAAWQKLHLNLAVCIGRKIIDKTSVSCAASSVFIRIFFFALFSNQFQYL